MILRYLAPAFLSALYAVAVLALSERKHHYPVK